ncbi:MAG: NAAT family transporter [Simkaniaceae bacterium]|nr:NAAT family transporter [Simkaniaceae bacterium]
MSVFSIAFSLFLLMDPIGNVPIYVSILKKLPVHRQRIIIIRELIIALFVILFFTLIGNYLLNFLGIKQETIQIAGGIILFIIALRMIFPSKHGIIDLPKGNEPLIVPLAIPLVAGPSVLAAVMIYSHKDISFLGLSSAIILAWIGTTIILISSSFLKRILKERGIIACERLMGMILTLISIQMFLDGFESILKK